MQLSIISKVFRKVLERYQDFSTHPISTNYRLKALFRYISFNTVGRYKKELIYNWVEGLRFYARIGDASMSGNIYFGMAEFSESCFCIHFLRKGDLFIDVGANLGHYSLLASGLTGCQSIAIEPVPATFLQLKRQITLNELSEKIQSLNLGLADKNGKLFFSSKLGTMNKVVSDSTLDAIEVPVKTLDTVAMGRNVCLIKIDVEGFEKFVLQGAQETLLSETLKVIIMELNGSGKNYGVEDNELYLQIMGKGFKPYAYDPMTRKLKSLKSYNKTQYNTIFIRDLDFVETRLQQSEYIKVWNKRI